MMTPRFLHWQTVIRYGKSDVTTGMSDDHLKLSPATMNIKHILYNNIKCAKSPFQFSLFWEKMALMYSSSLFNFFKMSMLILSSCPPLH